LITITIKAIKENKPNESINACSRLSFSIVSLAINKAKELKNNTTTTLLNEVFVIAAMPKRIMIEPIPIIFTKI